MNNITTYAASRKNIFVWIAVLASIVSIVSRVISAAKEGLVEESSTFLFLVMPIVASLFIAVRFPLRGEQQFYITILPVIMLSIYMFIEGRRILEAGAVKWGYMALIVLFVILYFVTFIGKLGTKYIVLLNLIAIAIMGGMDSSFRAATVSRFIDMRWVSISDSAIVISILAVLLSARKLPPYKEGDPYRLRFGDRLDGRRVHGMPVMSKVTPHFMPTRLGRSNYISDTVEISNMEKYIRQKRSEGYKHFGITHVILGAYIRTTADFPELNRFVAGQRIYHRFDTSVNMVVKKEMNKNSEDSSVKVFFDPADTSIQIYEKFNAAVENARKEGVANNYDLATYILDYLPSLVLAAFGFLVRFLDYFSMLPRFLERVSPFHGSLFVTSMGSLGIPPIFHHLYDFGTVPVFIAFGHKYSKQELTKDGEQVTRKYLDYKIVCDEGICDGFYYAAAMKKVRSYLNHPEKLDMPPEEVKQDIY